MSRRDKLIDSKLRWAQERRFLVGSPPATHGQSAQAPLQTPSQGASPAPSPGSPPRLPPGQHTVRNWPVLDLGEQPPIDLARWRLEVHGLVDRPLGLNWAQYQALTHRSFVTDIHCVTTWSRYDNHWRGLATRDLLALVAPQSEARFVMLHSRDGYTTNLPIDDFAADDALLAHQWQGQPLSAEHGGPLRVVVPHLYFWKSAKWVQRIEFRATDAPGFWEQRGYHRRGDPWQEQRYRED